MKDLIEDLRIKNDKLIKENKEVLEINNLN